jgi:hypothetical protein
MICLVITANGGCSLASLSIFDATKRFMHDLIHVPYEGVYIERFLLSPFEKLDNGNNHEDKH